MLNSIKLIEMKYRKESIYYDYTLLTYIIIINFIYKPKDKFIIDLNIKQESKMCIFNLKFNSQISSESSLNLY